MQEHRGDHFFDPLTVLAFGQIDGDDTSVDVDAVDSAPVEHLGGQHVSRIGVAGDVVGAEEHPVSHAAQWSIRLKPNNARLGN